jgi:hypothetical protein
MPDSAIPRVQPIYWTCPSCGDKIRIRGEIMREVASVGVAFAALGILTEQETLDFLPPSVLDAAELAVEMHEQLSHGVGAGLAS